MLLELTAGDPALDRGLQRGVVAGLSAALHCRAPGDPLLMTALRALPEHGFGPTEGRSPSATVQLGATTLLVEALGLALTDCSLEARTRLSQELVTVWQRLDDPTAAKEGEAKKDQAGFALRYRILQSLERLDAPTAEGTALLTRVLAQEPEPVLRQAAARAAVTSHAESEAVQRTVEKALTDADPGVRLAVLAALGERRLATLLPATEQVLRSDRWPLVRRAATESRAAQCPLSPKPGHGAGARRGAAPSGG